MKNKSLQLLVVVFVVLVVVGALISTGIGLFRASDDAAEDTIEAGLTYSESETVPPGWNFHHMATQTGMDGYVSLTFDDGPSEYTPDILDILAEHEITATFCVTGTAVQKHPDIAQRILDDGHQLCNHSYSHQASINHGPTQEIVAEIDHTNEVVDDEIGFTNFTWYRAPGGNFGGNVPLALTEKGLRGMSWDVDSRDWARPGVDSIVSNVMDPLGPQSIILLHDGGGDRSQTVAALPTIIDRIQESGLNFTTPGQYAH